jgi:AbrB family looped-hinge helix DNA binding protein
MSIATVTSKGQITIPQDVRERHGIVTGTRVEFLEHDGVVEFVPLTGSIMDLKGIVHWDGPPLTQEQVDDGIAAELLNRDLRSRGVLP